MMTSPRDNPANWVFHLYDEPTTEKIRAAHDRDSSRFIKALNLAIAQRYSDPDGTTERANK